MTRATTLTHSHEPPADTVTLTYDDRFRRRIALTGDQGTAFLLDLAEATELRAGDRLLLDDGRTIEVRAAPEDLMRATSPDPHHLIRTAWHVGNRHLPCAIHPDHLILRWDHVIADMLEQLGCTVERIEAPFTPEGGAYGHGRTHSHAH
ncbi:urease accessory protein [Rubricella aquisinus]|uniref:Urease accessory protein UreE n=1 Tax=Rubricella aquisinus TaxID=2028108 RepID=A0A840WRB7_9RHOB|nr:urease accessory protein UreE [Rubricella aquisinus]MBB5516212.1 urease accessory protein [Rubricella aquisinus]